jgi:hypothetical protein
VDLKEFRARHELSEITERLYIGPRPDDMTSAELEELGVRMVISMTLLGPPRGTVVPPMKWVHVPSIDFPLTPIPLRGLHRGLLAALDEMGKGNGVFVHCRWGRHRSVVLVCCILIALGCDAESAIALVEARRPAADPRAFYVQSRIRTFERVWHDRWAAETTIPDGIPRPPCADRPA